MRSPKPPAPMNAAIVAVPTLITAAVLTPAISVGAASGSWTWRSAWRARHAERERRLRHPARDALQAGVGVANDRQQRVEKEREHRRHDADRADERDQEREQRERRNRLQQRDGAEHERLAARPAPGGDAERNADDERRARARRGRGAGAGRRGGRSRARRRARRGSACGRAGSRAAPLASRRRHRSPTRRPRRCAADAAAKPPARNFFAVSAKLRPSSSTSPFIAIIVAASIEPASRASGAASTSARIRTTASYFGKEAEVVVEHRQAEAAELGVGRVDVDHVDAAGGDGVVGEAVVEADRLARARAVGLAQRRPAVGALQELVREAERERRAAAGLNRSEMRADAERLGLRRASSPARRCC